MSQEVEYQTERLDHLGIVAGVCREAGIAAWLDAQAGENRRTVSVGTAVVAMILNGLGFSHRQLYLVPQFIVATNVIEAQTLSHEQVFLTYKEQGGVERGFRFLKDPLFLASSVFVKKGDACHGPELHHGPVVVRSIAWQNTCCAANLLKGPNRS